MPYVIGGRAVNLPQEPRNMNGPVYVPLRDVLEAMGGQASWDPASRSAGATLNGSHARVATGSTTVDVDGRQLTLSVPTMIEGNTFWVPIEFFGKAFGTHAVADASNTVRIDTSAAARAA